MGIAPALAIITFLAILGALVAAGYRTPHRIIMRTPLRLLKFIDKGMLKVKPILTS